MNVTETESKSTMKNWPKEKKVIEKGRWWNTNDKCRRMGSEKKKNLSSFIDGTSSLRTIPLYMCKNW